MDRISSHPPDASEMTVYYLRHDSDMAKCLAHNKEGSHLVEDVGRVGVCNGKFDYEEIYYDSLNQYSDG